MNKIVTIQAQGKPIYKDVSKVVETGQYKKGFLGRRKPITEIVTKKEIIGRSDCQIDLVQLEELNTAIKELNTDGYEVVSVTPITSGQYDSHFSEGNGFKKKGMKGSYGYGYSYTEGLIITAKRTQDT